MYVDDVDDDEVEGSKNTDGNSRENQDAHYDGQISPNMQKIRSESIGENTPDHMMNAQLMSQELERQQVGLEHQQRISIEQEFDASCCYEDGALMKTGGKQTVS